MPGDLDAPAAEAPAAEMELMRRAALCPSERADAITYDWTQSGLESSPLAGVYPIVVAIVLAS